MSKKITSFLTMLVALFMSVSAMAQLDELQLKTITIGEGVAAFEPDTWYFLHQGRDGTGVGTYAPVLAGELPTYGGFIADQGVGNDLMKKSIDDVPEGASATGKAAYLVRFVPTDHEGAYNIQFGTGNWLTGPAGSGNSQKFSTTSNYYDAGEFNLYAIDPEGAPGAFGFNVYDMGQRVDNNGTGYTVVTWESGAHETALNEEGMITANSIWSIIDVVWGEEDQRDALLAEFSDLMEQYRQYEDSFTPGTDPGQYDPEKVAAFKAALEAAYQADGPDIDNYTDDQIRQLMQAIKDTYEAVLASKVGMKLPDGYYFIQTAMPYQTTVTDGETGEQTTIEVPKFMYSAVNGSTFAGRWGTPDYDCPKLWYVKGLEEGRFDIENMATHTRFDEVMRSTAVTMSTTSTAEMVVTPVTTKDGVTFVNINVYPQNAGEGRYLHQNGHGAANGVGTGTGSTLVGWYSTYNFDEDYPQASEWRFVQVSEEEALQMIADYEPIANREVMLAQYDSIMTNAKQNLDIAKDLKLVTAVSQLSSPYTESSEGSIAGLLDGNTSTFWHSAWSAGNVEGGTHYLQVDMVNPVDEEIYLVFTRRAVTNDHITEWGVYGTNEFSAEKDACEEITTLDTPYGSNTETITTDPFETKGYRYLRFYINNTTGTGNGTRGFGHMSEFQLYRLKAGDNAQVNFMGDLATTLESVIGEQESLERDDITIDEFNALKAAYDAFMTKFVDPTELRNTLNNLAETADVVVVGTQPGFWSADNGAGAFKTLYEEAKAYDATGNYTPEQSRNYVDQLTAQSQDIFSSAIGIQTGKWYRIRFATEEEFEEYEWDKVAGNGSAQIPSLFGKYISVANYFEEDGTQYIEPISAEEVGLGHQIYFLAEGDIQYEDAAMFRFIAVGDSAYMLQNKATGMFLRAAGTSGAVTFSAHPTLFNVRAIGYGENVISAKSITGEYQSNLHAQVSHNVLVTWDVDYPGSRSGLYIEEAEDVAGDFDGTVFNVPLAQGAVKAFCFPVEVSVPEGSQATMWGVSSIEGTTVKLSKVEGAAAGGRPFILVNGKTEDYDAELADDTEMVTLKHGYEITATEPTTAKGLKGSFYGEPVGAGVIVTEGNTLVISKRSNTTVGANSAYIATEEPYTDLSATLEVIWDETAPDGIQTALQNVSKSGAVYTLDGRLVSRKATLNDLSGFGKGIYILNGVKVVVK